MIFRGIFSFLAGTGNESLAECAENEECFLSDEFNLSVEICAICG